MAVGVAQRREQRRAADGLDLTALCVGELTGSNVKGLVDLFQEVGKRELRLLVNSGLVVGLALGLLQSGCSLVLPRRLGGAGRNAAAEPERRWVPLVGSGVVGCVTNWIALLWIFNPVDPRRFGPVTLQGCFLRRQPEVARASPARFESRVPTCVEIKIYGAFVLNHRVVLHAIAMAWRCRFLAARPSDPADTVDFRSWFLTARKLLHAALFSPGGAATFPTAPPSGASGRSSAGTERISAFRRCASARTALLDSVTKNVALELPAASAGRPPPPTPTPRSQSGQPWAMPARMPSRDFEPYRTRSSTRRVHPEAVGGVLGAPRRVGPDGRRGSVVCGRWQPHRSARNVSGGGAAAPQWRRCGLRLTFVVRVPC